MGSGGRAQTRRHSSRRSSGTVCGSRSSRRAGSIPASASDFFSHRDPAQNGEISVDQAVVLVYQAAVAETRYMVAVWRLKVLAISLMDLPPFISRRTKFI